MMEPISIGAVVAAFIAKALDRAEDGVLDTAVEAARKAVTDLRKRFSGDAEADSALGSLVKAPDSRRREKALADILDRRAQESPAVLEELEAIVREVEAAGVQIGSIKQIVEDGDSNVQLAGIVDSQVNLQQGAVPGSRD